MSKARTVLPTYVDAPSVYIGGEWTPSTIVKNVRNSTGVHRIDIEVEKHIASQYKRPGQYIKVQGVERPVLLAIASPPDERNVLSFLVKDTPYHKYLLDLPAESSIDLSIPMGRGFQIQEALNTHNDDQQIKHIVLMACGSGLAPIAAVIESGCLQLSPTNSQEVMDIKKSPDRTITLYIGARTRAHLPFAERYAEWEKKGVKVVPVLSRTEGRYVQEALQAELLEAPENTLALLCGMKGMTDAATELLLAAGVPKSRILLNF
uniref:Oxidoreductase FAD/NAD(P)-binding domain-containing protein n=1 Tax=Spumella elongata TaxID=89044 RepID=A0A7S3HI11_9STRA|eukprot:CAMPEP_0184991912 /NCGR_PEP_ID=MMETSP1098-20130426/38871_1 /TAXON_ID=89044 /ORGANISM="Spumella elongata, Strain CCAP 955/1" /LENGTH=262 /DNA_ID=CAMNT_0027517435 /DNA_START=84 /DNA_END=872 /DNA_ORIENTATION=-